MASSIEVVEGDLLECTEKYLCHQTNCVTSRSKHLAKAVFTRFPYADIYSTRSAPSIPGSIIIKGNGTNQRFVANLLGQYYPGCKYPNSSKDGKGPRIDYFKLCLEQLKKLDGGFAFPWRIGCGAAGGDWNTYHAMLENFSKEVNGKVRIYKLPAPTKDPAFKTLF